MYMYTHIYIYIYIYYKNNKKKHMWFKQPTKSMCLSIKLMGGSKTYPHPRIPAARLFPVFLCFPMFSSTWGNPEVGGGANFWGSY